MGVKGEVRFQPILAPVEIERALVGPGVQVGLCKGDVVGKTLAGIRAEITGEAHGGIVVAGRDLLAGRFEVMEVFQTAESREEVVFAEAVPEPRAEVRGCLQDTGLPFRFPIPCPL